jgi:hypothetical protein
MNFMLIWEGQAAVPLPSLHVVAKQHEKNWLARIGQQEQFLFFD